MVLLGLASSVLREDEDGGSTAIALNCNGINRGAIPDFERNESFVRVVDPLPEDFDQR